MTTSKADLAERYAQMHNKGAQLYKSREVKFFAGFGPELRNNLLVAAVMDVTGKDHLTARFASFTKYFSGLGGRALTLLVGRDFPVHVTVQQMVGSGGLPPVTVPAFPFGPIAFDTVVIDPTGNILLTATEVPDWLHTARGQIEATARKSGYEPSNLSIVHMTVARLKSVADDYFYEESLDAVRGWNREFANLPLVLPTKHVFVGSTASLLGVA